MGDSVYAFDLARKSCMAALYGKAYENERFAVQSIPLAYLHLYGLVYCFVSERHCRESYWEMISCCVGSHSRLGCVDGGVFLCHQGATQLTLAAGRAFRLSTYAESWKLVKNATLKVYPGASPFDVNIISGQGKRRLARLPRGLERCPRSGKPQVPTVQSFHSQHF
jgi:hypothetical protein